MGGPPGHLPLSVSALTRCTSSTGDTFGEDCLLGFHDRQYSAVVISEKAELYLLRRHQAARALIKYRHLLRYEAPRKRRTVHTSLLRASKSCCWASCRQAIAPKYEYLPYEQRYKAAVAAEAEERTSKKIKEEVAPVKYAEKAWGKTESRKKESGKSPKNKLALPPINRSPTKDVEETLTMTLEGSRTHGHGATKSLLETLTQALTQTQMMEDH